MALKRGFFPPITRPQKAVKTRRSGPEMNAYKNKLSTVQPDGESCVVDLPQLHAWYEKSLAHDEPRTRIAVSGSNISRGAFGSFATIAVRQDAPGDELSPVAE